MAVVISDAGPLIAFIDANCFGVLLFEFEEIIVPLEVKIEVFERRLRAKPRQVKVAILDDPKGLARYAELRGRLDAGEAAAVALAESRNLPLLMDERAGTRIALELNIRAITTTAVLQTVVGKNLLTRKQAEKILRKMRENGTYLPDVGFSA